MEKLIEIIEKQQQGQEGTAVFMVGEQLKDIAASDPKCLELLKQDLVVEGMGIADAEKELKKYADKHKGKGEVSCFCVSPIAAEGVLRKFYGLPKIAVQAPPRKIELPETGEAKRATLSLLDFM